MREAFCGCEGSWGTAGNLPLMQSLGLPHLDTAVAPVSHDDVSIGVHSYSRRGIELPVALTVGAKLEEELSIGTVHLSGQRAGNWGLGLRQRVRPWSRMHCGSPDLQLHPVLPRLHIHAPHCLLNTSS